MSDRFRLTVREATDDGGEIECVYWLTADEVAAFARGERLLVPAKSSGVDVAADGTLVEVYGGADAA